MKPISIRTAELTYEEALETFGAGLVEHMTDDTISSVGMILLGVIDTLMPLVGKTMSRYHLANIISLLGVCIDDWLEQLTKAPEDAVPNFQLSLADGRILMFSDSKTAYDIRTRKYVTQLDAVPTTMLSISVTALYKRLQEHSKTTEHEEAVDAAIEQLSAAKEHLGGPGFLRDCTDAGCTG